MHFRLLSSLNLSKSMGWTWVIAGGRDLEPNPQNEPDSLGTEAPQPLTPRCSPSQQRDSHPSSTAPTSPPCCPLGNNLKCENKMKVN